MPGFVYADGSLAHGPASAAYVQILNFKIMTIDSTHPLESAAHKASLPQTGSAIQTSVEAIADSLHTLEQQSLVGYLPISAYGSLVKQSIDVKLHRAMANSLYHSFRVMCIVLPFVLHSMGVKLLPAAEETPASQKRTDSFLQLIRALQLRQNNVNPVTNIIEKILTCIQPRKPLADWKQLISTQPDCYLRVLKTLDFALSTGKFPYNTGPLIIPDADLPSGDASSELDSSLGLCEGQAEGTRQPGDIQSNLEADIGELWNDSEIIQSLWPGEEEFLAMGADTDMAGQPSGDSTLCDVLGICKDQDFEALFNSI